MLIYKYKEDLLFNLNTIIPLYIIPRIMSNINRHNAQIYCKGADVVIKVTKDEAEYLRKVIDNVRIIKTCKLKRKGNRGQRYAEETKPVLFALEEYRENHD